MGRSFWASSSSLPSCIGLPVGWIRLRKQAESALNALLPLIESWQRAFQTKGIALSHNLLSGPLAPLEDPHVEAGLNFSLRQEGKPSKGFVVFLNHFLPDDLEWLAAEIDFRLQSYYEGF